MKIVPLSSVMSSRTGTLRGLTKEQIDKVLGFEPNVQDDPVKVVNSWGFRVARKQFAIWDYKGSHQYNEWSTFGDAAVLTALFGEAYSR